MILTCPKCGEKVDLQKMGYQDAEEVDRLRKALHGMLAHPDYEYETTDGPRKGFYEEPPSGDGWEKNVDWRGGWERFDYHEEAYWRRRKEP